MCLVVYVQITVVNTPVESISEKALLNGSKKILKCCFLQIFTQLTFCLLLFSSLGIPNLSLQKWRCC